MVQNLNCILSSLPKEFYIKRVVLKHPSKMGLLKENINISQPLLELFYFNQIYHFNPKNALINLRAKRIQDLCQHYCVVVIPSQEHWIILIRLSERSIDKPQFILPFKHHLHCSCPQMIITTSERSIDQNCGWILVWMQAIGVTKGILSICYILLICSFTIHDQNNWIAQDWGWNFC